MPIRVAQIVGRMGGGGVEATVMNYYRHIDRSQVQFDFVAQTDSTAVPEDEIKSLGGRVFYVSPYRNPIEYVNSCRKLFKQINPSIVHSHMNAISVFTLMAAKQAGVPIRIAHSHSTADPSEKTKTFVKNMLRPFSRVYPTQLAACSEHAARWLFGEQAMDSGRVHIVRNAIDIDRFTFNPESRSRKRRELGVDDSQLLIGQIGRICFQKNQTFTVNAFSELLKKKPNAVLVFIGSGNDSDLRAQLHDLGIERNVRLMGIRNDVADFYSAFDVLAFPSMYEGLGMVSIEAQTADLPVVCSPALPSEADLVPELVQRISLDAGADAWASALDKYDPVSSRLSRKQEIITHGYEICLNATELLHWYKDLKEEYDG